MEFEWDIDKNQANQKKHQISFEEAAEIFRYPTYEIVDTRVDYGGEQVSFAGQMNYGRK
jgi:uncharacterized DUF497 family protein